KLEPVADLLRETAHNLSFAFSEPPGPYGQQSAGEGHLGELGYGHALHADGEAGRPQTLAAAVLEFDERHVLLERLELLCVATVVLLRQELQQAGLAIFPFEQKRAVPIGKLPKRSGESDLTLASEALNQPFHRCCEFQVGSQRSVEQRFARINNDL